MKYRIYTETLLNTLQKLIGVVEKRQTQPVLSNVLLICKQDQLLLKATDTDIEIQSEVTLCEILEEGEITVPAKKLFDICRTLPKTSQIDFTLKNNRAYISSDKSRFILSTLPASEYPSLDKLNGGVELQVRQCDIKHLFDKTSFSMAQQDVRYYLNGLLQEITSEGITAVTTDGHRLSVSQLQKPFAIEQELQVIIPRKGITEFLRLINDSEEEISLRFTNNHMQVTFDRTTFTSKLIDGRFPDYRRVVPDDRDSVMLVEKERLKSSLVRAAILTNDKYKGVRFFLDRGLLRIKTHNPEKEEAEEELEVDYQGELIEVGFNVNYLLDILNVIDTPVVQFNFKDSTSSCLIHNEADTSNRYVVMPMRL